ncbi:MAG TPA: serine hydrolase domain-containing protein, partial [Trebonia sp.]
MAHGFPAQGGFTEQGLVELDAALERHVSPGEVPGLVALVARADGPRNGQVHVTVAGSATLGDPGTPGDLGPPLRRDSVLRIASLSKPVTGVAAMLLIEDGAMALDDPVERWLPELSGRRVLRALDSPLDDTVPAARPVTVEDVLSFRLGFGCIMTPGSYPIADAEASLGLRTLEAPWPPGRLTSDEWIAALGGLPLMDQPGQRFRYNTGATVAGILIERVTGLPLPQVLAKRVFEPLGMIDTGFYVPAAKLGRFTSMYAPSGFLGSAREGLELFDAVEGWYATPP